MRKLIAALVVGLCAQAGQAITYQSVRASTANVLTPSLQTGAMNLSSGTITSLTVGTLNGASPLTGVTAGYGLTGGGTSGSVTLNLNGATTSYIQNSTSTQTNSAFNVSTGTISSATITGATISSVTVGTALIARGTQGTAGQVLLSSGAVAAPIWSWQGLVVQSVQATVTSSSATTVSAFVPTNLSGSITPKSATNRVKLTTSCELSITVGSGTGALTFTRNGSNLGTSNGFVNVQINVTGSSDRIPVAFAYIDSPNTTSSTTYAVAMQTSAGTVTFDDNSVTCVLLMEELGPP